MHTQYIYTWEHKPRPAGRRGAESEVRDTKQKKKTTRADTCQNQKFSFVVIGLTTLYVGYQRQQQQAENVSARVTDHRSTIFPAAVETRRWLSGVGTTSRIPADKHNKQTARPARRDAARRSATKNTAKHDTTKHDTTRQDRTRHGTTRYGVVWPLATGWATRKSAFTTAPPSSPLVFSLPSSRTQASTAPAHHRASRWSPPNVSLRTSRSARSRATAIIDVGDEDDDARSLAYGGRGWSAAFGTATTRTTATKRRASLSFSF